MISMPGPRWLSGDASLGRWFGTDPQNQFASPYLAMGNNPVNGIDPDGEFFIPALIGAGISVITNGINNLSNNQSFFNGAGKAAFWGAIGGAASFGIGVAFQGTGSFGNELLRAGAHALSGGTQSELQGGNFLHGFFSGGFASGVSSGISAFGGNGFSQILGGGLSGGVGSKISGGNFWQGAGTGIMVGALNHAYQSGISKVRENIAKFAEGYIGSTEWNYDVEKDNFGQNTNKCNKFVYDVTTEAGASPDLPNGNWIKKVFGFGSPPTAGQWADADYEIPGWKVSDKPGRGSVAAMAIPGQSTYTGHTGIVSGMKSTISANGKMIIKNDWGFRSNQSNVVFRKWVGRW